MTQQAPDRAPTGGESASLSALLESVPEGWTRAIYNGRTYGLARTTRAGGRSITISAEELGGTDLVTGTSFAAAVVSGAIANLLHKEPGRTAESVEKALADTATDLGDKGRDTDFGFGLINTKAAEAAKE